MKIIKTIILGLIFLLGMFSSVYFTANSQTVLELAIWCLFFTVFFSLCFAYENKKKYNNSFKQSLSDIASYSVTGGLVCFGGIYFYLFP